MIKLRGEETSPAWQWEIMERRARCCPPARPALGTFCWAHPGPAEARAGGSREAVPSQGNKYTWYIQARLASFLLPPTLHCPIPAQLYSRWMSDGDHHVRGGTLLCPHSAWRPESHPGCSLN